MVSRHRPQAEIPQRGRRNSIGNPTAAQNRGIALANDVKLRPLIHDEWRSVGEARSQSHVLHPMSYAL